MTISRINSNLTYFYILTIVNFFTLKKYRQPNSQLTSQNRITKIAFTIRYISVSVKYGHFENRYGTIPRLSFNEIRLMAISEENGYLPSGFVLRASRVIL